MNAPVFVQRKAGQVVGVFTRPQPGVAEEAVDGRPMGCAPFVCRWSRSTRRTMRWKDAARDPDTAGLGEAEGIAQVIWLLAFLALHPLLLALFCAWAWTGWRAIAALGLVVDVL